MVRHVSHSILTNLTLVSGYTQSGPLFHAKTRALEKLLIKSFPPSPPAPHRPSPLQQIYPGGPQLIYPTAPIRLFPADIPGYEAPVDEEKEEPDVWGWWKRETGSGRYAGLEEGLDRIAESIQEVGGIDGVIGFSQGAAAAGMVASLLQPGRQTAFSSQTRTNPESFPYPKSWEPLQQLHPEGLKFAVSYSGFYAPNSLYTAFYEPKITSPFLHFIGSLDSVVEESRSLALVGVCEKGSGRTVYHPGGHFVPVGKEWGGVLVGFIRECIEPKMKEEDVADMDVPF
jgi:predicted esterase